MATNKLLGSRVEKSLSSEKQQAKINEIRKLIGPISSKFPVLCSDASILRYLRARNWNTKKASKMLKETFKWRLEYMPEKIRWEDVAHEAKNGKLYIANYFDKSGRTVLIMRPGFQVPEQQSAGSTEGQIKYLIYCMEKVITDLKPDQEQMVWLIDFQGWNMSSISVKLTRETAHVLQDHYPERLGLAILYNPPKLFESFWLMVKPFIEPRTHKKVKFVFSDDPQGQKIMDEQFDMERLESVFGGRNSIAFDFQTYAKRMEDEDKKATDCVNSECSSSHLPTTISESSQQSEISASDLASEASDEGDSSSNDETASSNLEVVDDKIKGSNPLISCNDQCGKNVSS